MAVSTTFRYTGAQQTYVIPAGVEQVRVECSGASGGAGYPSSGAPGRGGYTNATITVTPGETLYVFVGGKGGDAPGSSTAGQGGGAAGWNGGGPGGTSLGGGAVEGGGGGGGASDVRRGGTALSNRVVVAGGGGGAGGGVDSGGTGGYGGGLTGANGGTGNNDSAGYAGGTGGAGGTQTTGYTSNAGGPGGQPSGGGGGGYYGGFGGVSARSNNAGGGGGGGGSGYIAGSGSMAGGGAAVGDGLVVITPLVPNQPIPKTPPSGATIDDTTTNRFSWDFSSAVANDSESAFDLRYSSDGGTTWTTVSQTTPNTYCDFGGGTFADGSWQWQVRSYGSAGAVGPWSASQFFTAAVPPAGATITDPINGQTISTSSYTVTFSYSSLDQYAWRVLGDNAGTADTSNVINPGATVTDANSRTFTATGLPNDVTVHIQVQVYSGGLWSAWADSTNPVAYTPPAIPSAAASFVTTSGAIDVSIFNPAPAGGQPSVSYNDVYVTRPGVAEYRAATNVPLSSTWRDWTPNGDTAYRVVAVGSNGTSSSSDTVGGGTTGGDTPPASTDTYSSTYTGTY